MYRPTNHNLPDVIKGDTYNAILFTILVNDVAVDLSGDTIITMDMRLTPLGAVAKSFTSENSGPLFKKSMFIGERQREKTGN